MDIHFEVSSTRPDEFDRNTVYLSTTNWNDYGYFSSFQAYSNIDETLYVPTSSLKHFIGSLRIIHRDMSGENPQIITFFEDETCFESLATKEKFLSLWSDEDSYKRLAGSAIGREIMERLRDVAFKPHLLDKKVRALEVVEASLLRDVTFDSVRGRLNRAAQGVPLNIDFDFKFNATKKPAALKELDSELRDSIVDIEKETGHELGVFKASIRPNEPLPSTLHAIIGVNGAGKSETLKNIFKAFLLHTNELEFTKSDGTCFDDRTLSNVIYVSYSNMDQHMETLQKLLAKQREEYNEHLERRESGSFRDGAPSNYSASLISQSRTDQISISNIAFKYGRPRIDEDERNTSSIDDLPWKQPLVDSLEKIVRWGITHRWIELMEILAADEHFPFQDLRDGINTAADRFLERKSNLSPEQILQEHESILATVESASSGHTFVVTVLTHLLAQSSDFTLVLFDEPENHLHPSLLSLFLTAIEDLLSRSNSIGILATHSPIVLQQIPSNCVSILVREEDQTVFISPPYETFGETVSKITEYVYGTTTEKDVVERTLRQVAKKSVDLLKSHSFDDSIAARAFTISLALLNEGIGSEGRAQLMTLCEEEAKKQ